MKVLFVSQVYPWPLNNGTHQRVYHILQGLTRCHHVTLVTLVDSRLARNRAETLPLAQKCEQVIEIPFDTTSDPMWAPMLDRIRFLATSPEPAGIARWNSEELVCRLRHLRQTQSFDVVWAERHYIAESVYRAGYRKNVIVDLDELTSHALARTLKYSGWYRSKPIHYVELAKLALYERSLVRRFRRLILCKEQDRRFFGRTSRQVSIIPNGVENFPATTSQKERVGQVLFTGAMCYDPNIDAIQYFFKEIFPSIKRECHLAQLHIVGRAPVAEVRALHDGSRCFVHGDVPDMTPFFDDASVVVAPIRLGSGTRLKVLEALGRGKAVVATSIAAEGLAIRPGTDFEVADDPERFAKVCLRLLGNPEDRARLGAAGRERVRQVYHWDIIERRVENVVAQLCVPTDLQTSRDNLEYSNHQMSKPGQGFRHTPPNTPFHHT